MSAPLRLIIPKGTPPPAPPSKWHRERARLAALTRQLAYLEETRRQCQEGLIAAEAAIAAKRAAIAKTEAGLLRLGREPGSP